MTEDIKTKAGEILSILTDEEKAALCGGKDYWNLASFPGKGIPQIRVSDGPNGLRKTYESESGAMLNDSVPATCFPASATTGCSFDEELMEEIGRAIGEECREEGISVVLGPGINIKRSPLCGRNFEYISEDPLVTSKMASGFTKGVQSQNVGVSLKHFACNNQEKGRVVVDAVVDDRALREIYLSAFESVVKDALPWTVMCSYNRLWGKYNSENKKLLTDILRTEWGYDGLVVSDWGAVSNRVEGVKAGLDLEMPYSGGDHTEEILKAVEEGTLSRADLDRDVLCVLELILRAQDRKPVRYNKKAHHMLARKAAENSMVLLKNEGGLLPASLHQKTAVIGMMAKDMRYQGAGSSHINPNLLDSPYDEFIRYGIDFDYAPGYDLSTEEPQEELIIEACIAAEGKDIVFLFAGLPARYESEGFDRTNLQMPLCMTELIRRVSEVNPNTAVILFGGSAMDTGWSKSVPSILAAYLPGEAGGEAVVRVLMGDVNPSGKLEESWPVKLSDNPSFSYFPGYPKTVEYRESVFVGYRYYDTAQIETAYPFGHGLSYTVFEYRDLSIKKTSEEEVSVSLVVKNTGKRAGCEVVQAYIGKTDPVLFRPAKELRAFTKISLMAGEEKKVVFSFSKRDFSYWNVKTGGWFVERGEYQISVGSSSRDIRLNGTVALEGDTGQVPDYRKSAPSYYHLKGQRMAISVPEFFAVLGHKLPRRTRRPKSPYSLDSTLMDISERKLGRAVIVIAKKMVLRSEGMDDDMRNMIEGMMMDMPLRFLNQMDPKRVPLWRLRAFVDVMNSQYIKGISGLIRKGE